MSELVTPQLVRTLDVAEASQAGRRAHVASGSSLVLVGDVAWVAIDDELHVASFELGSAEPGRLVRVFEGELPLGHAPRKAHKPDVESVLCIDGRIVGIPSGSTAHRVRGFTLDPATLEVEPLDCSAMVQLLAARIDGELNIEGAAAIDDELVLLLREAGGANRVARLDLATFASAPQLRSLELVELGALDGVPLGFTDAATLGDRLLFSAAAEDTPNAYDDGPVVGSVVGELLSDGSARIIARLPAAAGKVEGLAMRDERRALLVTDDDDPAHPARMYELELT